MRGRGGNEHVQTARLSKTVAGNLVVIFIPKRGKSQKDEGEKERTHASWGEHAESLNSLLKNTGG